MLLQHLAISQLSSRVLGLPHFHQPHVHRRSNGSVTSISAAEVLNMSSLTTPCSRVHPISDFQRLLPPGDDSPQFTFAVATSDGKRNGAAWDLLRPPMSTAPVELAAVQLLRQDGAADGMVRPGRRKAPILGRFLRPPLLP